jgi:hypothetical protein
MQAKHLNSALKKNATHLEKSLNGVYNKNKETLKMIINANLLGQVLGDRNTLKTICQTLDNTLKNVAMTMQHQIENTHQTTLPNRRKF